MTVGDLVQPSPMLSRDDSLGRALQLIRVSGLPALSVADEGVVAGLVLEDDLAELAARAPDRLRTGRVGEVVRPAVPARADLSLPEALEHLREQGLRAVPVVGLGGEFLGLVSRTDLLAALAGTLAPRSVGGMATPLGVYLTTGTVRAGPGDLGLLLTGVWMMALYYLSVGFTHAVALGVQHYTGLPVLGFLLNPELSATQTYLGSAAGTWSLVMMVLQVVAFFLLLRLSPLAGTHGAEHMVVHAIEDGDPLTPENVRAKTTVHPRCGTNLMAAAVVGVMILSVLLTASKAVDPGVILGLLVLLWFGLMVGWRWVGPGLQRVITTKRPSERQLRGALAVGEELLERFRQRPAERGAGWRRLWQMGLVQVLVGFGATSYLVRLLLQWAGWQL